MRALGSRPRSRTRVVKEGQIHQNMNFVVHIYIYVDVGDCKYKQIKEILPNLLYNMESYTSISTIIHSKRLKCLSLHLGTVVPSRRFQSIVKWIVPVP